MITLCYRWNDNTYTFELFSIENGKEYIIGEFDDREDLLIYIEHNYTVANLIVSKK